MQLQQFPVFDLCVQVFHNFRIHQGGFRLETERERFLKHGPPN